MKDIPKNLMEDFKLYAKQSKSVRNQHLNDSLERRADLLNYFSIKLSILSPIYESN